MAHIAIDLGTTNSLISVFENGKPKLIRNAMGHYLTPSVVHLNDQTLTTGEAAKFRLVTEPKSTVSVFKRTMGAKKTYRLGKKQFTSEELSAVVLKSLKQDAEAYLKETISDVVISVPAYFNEHQRRAVKTASQMAGLNPIRLINEPTAAALAYGLQDLEQENTFLVFDLGGGTFDVSILEVFDGVMEVKATAGDAYLGGEDFTDTIVDHIIKTYKLGKPSSEILGILHRTADTIKHALSTQHEVSVDIPVSGEDITVKFTRRQFEELSTDLLQRLRRPVERAIYDAKLSIDDIERVILVGGATRMPLVRSFVGRMLKKLPEAGLDPDHIVALGAAVQAGLIGMDVALDDVVMTDVSAFTLGIEISKGAENRFDAGGFFMPIIERNTVIPVSREEIVYASQKGQTFVELNIYQGEAPRVDSNIFLGKLDINLPKNLKQHENVSVRFSYDVSGLLEIDTKVLSTGKTQNLLIQELAGNLSDAQIKTKLKALEKLKTHPRDDASNITTTARLEQCYAMARLDDRHYIQDLLVEFERVLALQNLSDIEIIRDRIIAELDGFEAGYVS